MAEDGPTNWYYVGTGRGNQRYYNADQLKGKGKGMGKGGKSFHLLYPPPHPPSVHSQKAVQQFSLEQQQQFLQQHHWCCHTCGQHHPFFHKVCRPCESWFGNASGKGGKGKSKSKGKGFSNAKGEKAPLDQNQQQQSNSPPERVTGRWRSGKGVPKHWNDHNVHVQAQADVFDMSADDVSMNDEEPLPTCNAEEIGKVIGWLKSKNVDGNVIEILGGFHDEQTKKADETKTALDPWRALQSVKDKLKNVMTQLDSTRSKVDDLSESLRLTRELQDELDNKKEALEAEAKELQQKALASMSAPPESPPVDEVQDCSHSPGTS